MKITAILLFFFCGSVFAEINYSKMLESSCNFYDSIRTPNGDYLDLYNGNKPGNSTIKVSSASTGAGLVSLAIAHKIDHDPKAKEKALFTLKFLNGKKSLKPKRNAHGLFLHFYNYITGESINEEFSTIDSALLMSGAIFCKNVFKDLQISSEVDELWKSIQWDKFRIDTMHYYLTEDKNGKGLGKTRMFNEYILLADYCALSMNIPPPKISDKWIRCKAYGFPVLSDLPNRMLPLFTFQFPLYLSPIRTKDKVFLKEALRAAQADKAWWEKEIKVSGIWGSSAGSSNHGYGVDATGKNHYRIVHAPSVLGFAPFKDEYKKDFEKILRDYPEIIQTEDKWSIAWRHSIKYPDWPARTIQAIDASPLLYGLAAMNPKLGFKFFQVNSQYSVE